MITVSRIALSLALAIGVAATATPTMAFAKKDKKEAAADQGPKYDISKPAQKLLSEGQAAQAAGDHATAIAKFAEAKAAAQKPDDSYLAALLTASSAQATNNMALLEESLTAVVDSGRAPAEQRKSFQRNLAALALQRNDLGKAISHYERLAAENPEDGELVVSLGEMYQRNKQLPMAVATIGKAIAAEEAKGTVPPEAWYKRAVALAFDGKLAGDLLPASLKLVAAYPSPTNWRDVLIIFRDGAGLDDQSNLDAMRLMYDTNALTGERDFFEYAETASGRGLPGEAKMALDAGTAKGMLSPSKLYVKELVGIVTPKVKGDRASLAGLEKESRAAANGRLAKATADGYLGYGENAKAAELFRLALQKGGVDAGEVNTRLGIALTRLGDKAGAEAAFKSVSTGKRADLVKFWLAHLAAKPAAPAGAPAATSGD